MTVVAACLHVWPSSDRISSLISKWPALILVLAAWLVTACTRFSPPDIPRDIAAEQLVSELRSTNADLTRFKCVGKIKISGPNQPVQSFRAAIAGQLPNRLRIDMFAPFGGAAGTLSSDGKHLFLDMHRSRENYKLRFGNGSLQRFIKIDVSVGDLLELLMGRIPMDDRWSPRLAADKNEKNYRLVFVDRWGRDRQRVTFDDSGYPLASVWYDSHQTLIYSLRVNGSQTVDGIVLPKQIALSEASGGRVSVTLERYEANARFDDSLFKPLPPSS